MLICLIQNLDESLGVCDVVCGFFWLKKALNDIFDFPLTMNMVFIVLLCITANFMLPNSCKGSLVKAGKKQDSLARRVESRVVQISYLVILCRLLSLVSTSHSLGTTGGDTVNCYSFHLRFSPLAERKHIIRQLHYSIFRVGF